MLLRNLTLAVCEKSDPEFVGLAFWTVESEKGRLLCKMVIWINFCFVMAVRH